MTPLKKGRLTSLTPQLLVGELDRSIAFYKNLGFVFEAPWEGFYAIGFLDGLELHLKEAPMDQVEQLIRGSSEHLAASAGVDDIEAFYDQCLDSGVAILKPLADTPWGTKDFYIEDPDGNIISFGGRANAAD